MSIKLENVVLASPEQMEFIIEGMRNPMNSWEKSDSGECNPIDRCYYSCNNVGCEPADHFHLGENDHSLMQRLSNAGTEHRKYMRMMPVYVRITAPLYWWKEFDTYKVGVVANSCSTMHKIAEKEFEWGDFSTEHLIRVRDSHLGDTVPTLVFDSVIRGLNFWRNRYLKTKSKDDWWQLIQLLPSSYNQTRNVMMNYEVLANIYRQRKGHKLDEWREVCKWIKSLPYSELITGLPIESDQTVEEKRFPQPFPWNKDDVYCNNCEYFHDCLNSGGLTDVTTSDDIVKNGFRRQHYVNKPGYDCQRMKNMNDEKVSVKEALDKLYDLSWMIGSTSVEYLTDKDGEKIRDYIGVIEDRIGDLENELSEFKKYFEPYDIDEETAEAIIRSKCPNIDSAEDDPMNFSVGKIVHDLMAKELAEDIRKQILEEDSK